MCQGGPVSDDWARPVVHWEIVAREPDRLSEFYRGLFNWEIGAGPIMTVNPGLGGPEPGPGGHLRQGDDRGVRLYIQVRDLTTSLAQAAELGGVVITEPFDLPGAPTLAVIHDPEGNEVMLVQA
jgi:predicted enzyme related to lactoylglutathione lyase